MRGPGIVLASGILGKKGEQDHMNSGGRIYGPGLDELTSIASTRVVQPNTYDEGTITRKRGETVEVDPPVDEVEPEEEGEAADENNEKEGPSADSKSARTVEQGARRKRATGQRRKPRPGAAGK